MLKVVEYPVITASISGLGQNVQSDFKHVCVCFNTGVLISPQPDQEGNKLQRHISNFWKPLKKNSEGCPFNQVSAATMTSASDEIWRPFNCFFQSGRVKDLSAHLKTGDQTSYIWLAELTLHLYPSGIYLMRQGKRCSVLVNLQAPRFLYIGQGFRYSPENAFYIFNQQIYFII